MEKVLVGRVYKHFKGDEYLLEGIATDCEDLESVVIYRSLYGDGKVWVRKLSDFTSYKGDIKRFTLTEIESKKVENEK